jgi:hypothetical protein
MIRDLAIVAGMTVTMLPMAWMIGEVMFAVN